MSESLKSDCFDSWNPFHLLQVVVISFFIETYKKEWKMISAFLDKSCLAMITLSIVFCPIIIIARLHKADWLIGDWMIGDWLIGWLLQLIEINADYNVRNEKSELNLSYNEISQKYQIIIHFLLKISANLTHSEKSVTVILAAAVTITITLRLRLQLQLLFQE